MLDTGVGFYVSYNSAGKGELSPRSALWTHFIDRYFPYTAPDMPAPGPRRLPTRSPWKGYYMSSRPLRRDLSQCGQRLRPGTRHRAARWNAEDANP